MLVNYCCLVIILGIAAAAHGAECNISDDLRKEIRSYQSVVDQIIKASVNGPYSGVIYNDLANYLDEFGYRFQGTENLERAIDNVIELQKKAGIVVSEHKVMVPSWTRGEESAEILSPRRQKLEIYSLGSTSSTPPEGITAPVILIKDFDELARRQDEVAGKIVFFNAEFVTYGQTVAYRSRGPSEASKLKAVAVLVRSITNVSLFTPHAGNTEFEDGIPSIPAAAITLEDADMIARMVQRGQEVIVNIKTSAHFNQPVQSRNVIGDLVGATNPDEYVVMSGHIDSWDVGQGAMDDGGGCFVSWHSLALIKILGLKTPRRTIRSILWTSEEMGLFGSHAYRSERADEAKRWSAAFESDGGVFRSLGLVFAGNDEASCIMQEIFSMFGAINATTIERRSSAGSDIGLFGDLNVPLGEPLNPPDNKYFYYHHAPSDYVTALKLEDLDHNLAIFASTLYILADLSIPLPRDALPMQALTPTA